MVQTEDLITIQRVTDDETGIWSIGEVDYSINLGNLEDFIRHYGEEGRQELIDKLDYLRTYVLEKKIPEESRGGD